MSGIVGIITPSNQNAAPLILYGLYALQHRGQVNAGMATIHKNRLIVNKGSGLISDVFPNNYPLNLPGSHGLGHVKYGEYKKYDPQPDILPKEYEIDGKKCLISLDGNILNPDFELHQMTRNLSGSLEAAKRYLNSLRGAFAGIYMDAEKMIAFRDPWGLKPICAGKLDEGFIVASETCAIDSTGSTLIRDLAPGELVVINGEPEFHHFDGATPKRKCIFEYVYISRPDSYFDGVSVYNARYAMGKNLFLEHPTEADIVMGAPDSGLVAAMGYAEASKIPYKDGIIKNRYIGRTFINPDEHTRTKDIFIKLNPVKEVLKDKRVILVDDSIVRGSTVRRTIRMLKEAGASEVHVRIASPMVKFPCNLSVDTPDKDHLIACHMSLEEIRDYIGADSLYYITIDGLKNACQGVDYCDNCFTGNYPIKEQL